MSEVRKSNLSTAQETKQVDKSLIRCGAAADVPSAVREELGARRIARTPVNWDVVRRVRERDPFARLIHTAVPALDDRHGPWAEFLLVHGQERSSSGAVL